MIKFSFNINNGLEGNLYKFLGPIYDARRAAVATAMPSAIGQTALILEDFGTTLRQNAWTNTGGIFITYRVAPSYAHLPKMQEAATAFEHALQRIFGGRQYQRTADPHRPDLVTIDFVTDVTSIGD